MDIQKQFASLQSLSAAEDMASDLDLSLEFEYTPDEGVYSLVDWEVYQTEEFALGHIGALRAATVASRSINREYLDSFESR